MLVLSVHFTKIFDLEDAPFNEPLFYHAHWRKYTAGVYKQCDKMPSD